MSTSPSTSSIAIIVLAAGGSTRLGHPKQLLVVNGVSLLRHSAQVAVQSQASRCIIVLGAEAGLCATEVADLPVEVAINSHWRDGMSTSLRTGLQCVLRHPPVPDAVIVTLCDQPHLSTQLIDSLITAHRSTPAASIVASAYDATHLGPPALFTPAHYPRLLALTGDQGARSLFNTSPGDLTTVPFPQGLIDIDTPADYTRLTSPQGQSAR